MEREPYISIKTTRTNKHVHHPVNLFLLGNMSSLTGGCTKQPFLSTRFYIYIYIPTQTSQHVEFYHFNPPKEFQTKTPTKRKKTTTSVLNINHSFKKHQIDRMPFQKKHIHPSTLHHSPLRTHLSTPINLAICWVTCHEGTNKNVQGTHVGVGNVLKHGFEKIK